ncbi:MAG: hypothetical protein HYY22_09235 [Thaumarchaeota archaeon]|nr:hypothetical protein [Nitrososphaerota archaeon]
MRRLRTTDYFLVEYTVTRQDDVTMSLTSFLSIPAVKQMFAAEFPLPSAKLSAPMRAPPITKNYPLIGTAFDYLLRFYLQRLNPDSVTRSWIAEGAVEMYRSTAENAVELIKAISESKLIEESSERLDAEQIREDAELFRKTNDILTRAKTIHADYVKCGEINDDIIRAAILLAQLDPIYRAGVVDPNLGNVLDGDIADMRNLLNVVDAEKFRAKTYCVLNPTFGAGSKLVGAADADLLIDGNLIDIKTTKNLAFTRDHYNQLIGYYILSKIGGIDGTLGQTKVSHLSIYYSRHGLMHTIPVSIIEQSPRFTQFIEWFKRAAAIVFPNPA